MGTQRRIGVTLGIVLLFFWGLASAQSQTAPGDGTAPAPQQTGKKKSITNADRLAAAARAAAKLKAQAADGTLKATLKALPTPGGTPNYFGPEPNWAYSPPIRKFVDTLPGLNAAGANNLGQYIPVAVPDTTTFPGCDYYEIAVVEYTQKLHSDLPPTRLRGYVQLNDPAQPVTRDATGKYLTWPQAHYLGPLIMAQKDRAVRITFTNLLPTGAGGNLFLPVDTTEMGAGMGPLGMNVTPGNQMNYTQNRAVVHLHGGHTPWISDGTPHQWITPAGENTDYKKGVSAMNVPDMWFDNTTHVVIAGASLVAPNANATNDPGDGSVTLYFPNQQSSRFLFYHDHVFGITRLNVYAGEVSGYLLTDPVEQALIASGLLPPDQIPLILQDKTFVDAATILATDPTWNWGSTAPVPNTGDLWYPHVYMTNQNPNDFAGINALGRWDYGPWFWPPWPVANPPITLADGTVIPNVPDLSMTMEAFHDTSMVNGTPYPTVTLQPRAYRFRILNGANDRMWNLQWHQASPLTIVVTAGGTGYSSTPTVTISPPAAGVQATATATVQGGSLTHLWVTNPGSGYTTAPTVSITDVTGTGATAMASIAPDDVKMVPAVPGNWPAGWPTMDNRDGGIPDPALMGPSFIQIGNEAGFLPAPVIWPNTPIGWDADPKSITITNIKEHNLLLGGAERADVIVDFSAFAGKTLILYNDAPAAVPARDIRLDYYTGDLDNTATGGTGTTLPGFGPNIRTLLQVKVAAGPGTPYNVAALQAAFASTATTQGTFVQGANPVLVPQAGYNSAYNATFPSTWNAYARIQDTSLTFTPLGATAPMTMNFTPKAIAEEFEDTYGRMTAFLGVEVPFTNGMNQTTIFYNYQDPPSEIIQPSPGAGVPVPGDGTQIWKVTHNGVDTHPVHFHLFDVQVINRVDWAGVVKPPDANEVGWKETVRMNPLEDCIVALRPFAPTLPFGIPNSVRPLDPTMPIGSTMGFKNVDTNGNPITVTNQMTDFGWEYVWHCHILSHEEMDMMRPVVFQGPAVPGAPIIGTAAGGYAKATVNFSPPISAGSSPITLYTVTSSPGGITATGTASPIVVTGLTNGTSYTFTVRATNALGMGPASAPSNAVTPATGPGDLNGDGVVNILDLRLVIQHMGQTPASPGWDPRADANKDGVVNALDLAIVIQNYGKVYY